MQRSRILYGRSWLLYNVDAEIPHFIPAHLPKAPHKNAFVNFGGNVARSRKICNLECAKRFFALAQFRVRAVYQYRQTQNSQLSVTTYVHSALRRSIMALRVVNKPRVNSTRLGLLFPTTCRLTSSRTPFMFFRYCNKFHVDTMGAHFDHNNNKEAGEVTRFF